MKISIITVCYNSAKTISDTLTSVASQKNVDVEHLLIDGLSSDNTVSIIKKYDSVSQCISESDAGIYDAMNKGISLASGEIVGTLNADDFYENEYVLELVAKVFLDPSVQACYGDLLYVHEENTEKIVRFWQSNEYTKGLFKAGWMPAHPTFFVRKSVYERLGGFDLNYKIAADFELLFRFLELNEIKCVYIPKLMVNMRLGGTTNKNFSNIIRQNTEIIKILRKQYPDFSLAGFIFKKLLNRIFQFIVRPK